jgi:putative acetyltransferase
VLSFSTAVDIAVSRGATVYPFAYGNSDAAKAEADRVAAILARPRRAACGQQAVYPTVENIESGSRAVCIKVFSMQQNREISIRNYQPEDLEAVIVIFQTAVREIASRDYDPAQIRAWAVVDRDAWAHRRLSRPTWLAVIDQLPVGFTDLESTGHLDMMFVHPAHQRIGVATLLLRTVEAAARVKGFARLFTEASITARPFFAKRGFVLLASQRVEKRGQMPTNFRMEKRLV